MHYATKAPSTGKGFDVTKDNAPMTNYVFAMKEKIVYIYNTNTGVLATIANEIFCNT